MEKILNLFKTGPKVINIGLESFANTLKELGVEVVNLNWSPPASGKKELIEILTKLYREENNRNEKD